MKTASLKINACCFNGAWRLEFGTSNSRRRAFTMIEIAISLAVIGFALAAIIGVLPLALNVQRDNREETIINQDQSVFANAVRYGEHGLDDLTNSVISITRYWAEYSDSGGKPTFNTDVYTPTNSTRNGNQIVPPFALTNGFRIIGLLSTPKFVRYAITPKNTGFYSNYVVANFRALSGPASDTSPQTNVTVRDLAFSYRMVSDVIPHGGTNVNYNWQWTNYNAVATNSLEWTNRRNFSLFVNNLQANLYDTRFIFRWPLLPDGSTGNGRQIFRSMASGHLIPTNEPGYPLGPVGADHSQLFFFDSRNFVKAVPQ